ncbi:ATP-binding cassette domain-containing protein [Alicyclobacillus cycloheptanicus]|uniref:Energy-coupling factor transport system ATP-binding protein n=1 Tax=Alicyclobacillus cycloheptanicus TaxID=1457 RepID=A0ABT9XI83_9BACL|nr:ATP-binding cassette domain-containing protein [Alicyclobacillus cycloheptanicus]MDQ0190027.1 energy-coupling factor transport system ATP-binding protein [Alicyclobacillus cycloheptanicus]WDM00071.1 ATP-binding cassette domain-containing protein [Alicyclobacillus cycloheptanicus]
MKPQAVPTPALADPHPEERLLALQGVQVAYEDADAPVLRGVDFELYRGEAVLLLGPSGCGKSTLAMVCANLLPGAVEGTVTGGVWRSSALSPPGSVGYVFQDADAQFCMLSVADEVAFGLENLQVPQPEMATRMQRALAAAGLAVPLDANHATFSGGMKQKLAMACALAMDAPLLVLDEPTANLDPQSTRQVFEQIVALHRAGRTLLVIEHKFEPLIESMDRVVLFTRDGRIHRQGPAAQVIAEEWAWLVQEGVARPAGRRYSGGQHGGVREPVAGHEVNGAPHGQPELALSLRNARLAYGNAAPVWSSLSLDIPRGSFTAIVGPNGSGKSSLLEVMAGLRTVTEGDVQLLGQPMKSWKRRDLASHVSFCFQNPEYQFIYERVADEVANRVLDGPLPEAAAKLLAELGLSDTADQSPFALSQGQKRRLSVAVMLQGNHDVYLLDEPTFGQDAHTEEVIMQRLLRLQADGKTVVITTHDMSLVERYATQVVVLADGQLQFVGPPEALFANEAVMRRAHLLDDVTDVVMPTPPCGTGEAADATHAAADAAQSAVYGADAADSGPRTPAPAAARSRRRGLGAWLNPPVLLMAVLAAAFVAIFAQHLPQAVAVFGWPVFLMVTVFRMHPLTVLKRLSVFLVFYVLYTWSYVAFTRVPPGQPVIHLLWMHPSLSGLLTGLVLAFRMLAAVALGILFISNCDLTDLVVGWSSNFRIRPKFTYGMLAGMHFMPMFQSEWQKLRQARQLRGKDAPWALVRLVTYAIPILSQAIRLSERVAIAMEARGLIGRAAADAAARTYYRTVRVRAGDWCFAAGLVLSMILLLVVFR